MECRIMFNIKNFILKSKKASIQLSALDDADNPVF